jgi:selenocysteine lyase/cysteine desulfurase
LLADDERDTVNILRLNHLGTHPVYNTLGIKDAIDYLQDLGLSRKEERLRYLRLYWMEGLKDTPNVVFNTPWASERACAIGNVGLKNMAPAVMAQRLMDEYRIFTVAIDYANIKGCRITPNVFTTTAELDRFILAVKDLATS